MTNPTLSEKIALLFSNLDAGREVRTYLQHFTRSKDQYFALIKISGGLLDTQLDLIAERLALLQSLGLIPIVVYGAGLQLDRRLKDKGIKIERKNNLRITPKDAIPILVEEVDQIGLKLSQAIEKFSGRATLTPYSALKAEQIDDTQLGQVGQVSAVNTAVFKHIIEGQSIPLISCIVQDKSGQLLNVNADNITRKLAKALNPQKVLFLTPTGGLLNEHEHVINAINLASDYDTLRNADWLHSGMALKLQEIKELLDELPLESSVSITSPTSLIRELFTHGGEGTLIRRGEAIHYDNGFDRTQMTALFESAFEKPLHDNYWHGLSGGSAIYTEKYRAAALITSQKGFDILDKFAVCEKAKGEGLAKAVWRETKRQYPRLIWRSRLTNPINDFYIGRADGSVKIGNWLVLWYGQDLSQSLINIAQELASKPVDFKE